MKLIDDKLIWNRFPLGLILPFFCLMLISSCQLFRGSSSGVKQISEDSLKTDFYQNITSRYNILHNANLMLEQERKTIYLAADKNYQVRLSVFDEPTTKGDPHKAMDSLIQKAYKIVNNKQESRYINDAYFLIGRAYYLKGSYYTASAFFDKLIQDARPEQTSFKALAYAWKSRAYLQLGKLDAAGYLVDSAFMFLNDEGKTKTFVHAAKANYLLQVGKEEQAIPFLNYAIASTKRGAEQDRWKFLLAQLYRDSNNEEAYALFRRLAKSNVPFDMAFEASLQSAYGQSAQDNFNLALRVKPFLRMLNEGKNSGYRDQILFEIGKIYLHGGEEEQAMRYFNRSLNHVDRNPYQQTETFLVIADYLFSKEKYHYAQLYYDSTATVLPNNYTDVNKLRRKLAYMNELTTHYKEILWQDTLLALGKMTEELRGRFLDSLARQSLAQREQEMALKRSIPSKAEKKRPIAEYAAVQHTLPNQNTDLPASIFSDSRFYFNNQDALLLGASEFKRKWGNRQLKDDWRFAGDLAPQQIATQPVYTDNIVPSEKNDEWDAERYLLQYPQKYLDAMPITEVDVTRLLQGIHDHMIAIGNIYRAYIRDDDKAIVLYEEILERFPHSAEAPTVLYALFRMYEERDPQKSSLYRDRLIKEFPTNTLAMLAQDPYYMDKVARDKRTLDRAFERLFTLYAQGDHVAVIKQADVDLQGAFREQPMAPQIAYLRALAIGRVGLIDAFKGALDDIIVSYPLDSLVVPLARANRAFMEEHPSMFVNRVNALQDKDNLRVSFLDEPDMTPWPSLHINGDYRTAVAISQPPKKEDPQPKQVEQKTDEAKRNEVVALLEQQKATAASIKGQALDKKSQTLPAVAGGVLSANIRSSGLDSAVVEELLAEEKRAVRHIDPANGSTAVKIGVQLSKTIRLEGRTWDVGTVTIDFGANDYRDKKLFPDTATYYFAINVMDPRVNLAPSRYGIGQFNRSRYARTAINHQLNLVNAENQLLFVGPFETFEEVKTYETRILPLLPEIMKVPQEDYNSFIITREAIGTLTDGIQIRNYHQVYKEQ